MVAGALAGLCYLAWSFGSWSSFERSIDFNAGSFEDFTGPYYATGQMVFETAEPSAGFFYSPLFAILLGLLVGLQGETSAWTWLVLEVVCVGAIAWIAALAAQLRSAWSHALAGALVVTSFPVLHNFHWGQVSAPLVALELGALLAWQRGRARLGAALIALAAGVKFHPALFFLPFVAWGDKRSLRWGAAFLALFLAVVPSLVLGPAETIDFYRRIASGLAAAGEPRGAWDSAVNSQYLPAVLGRLVPGGGKLLESIAAVLALCVALAQLWLLAPLDRRSPRVLLLAFVLLWLATPLVVPPSWPHYFAHLPVCQLVLAVEAARSRPRGWLAVELVVAASVILASVPLFRALGDPERYGVAGFLAWADLVLLPAAWLWLARERRDGAAAT